MDTFKNKQYMNTDYNCRYSSTPYYYDTLHDREVFGLWSHLKKNISHVSHKVTETDTLHGLALKYYNNPTYWWAIADYNDIQDAFVNLYDYYKVLQIPSISSLEFGRTN